MLRTSIRRWFPRAADSARRTALALAASLGAAAALTAYPAFAQVSDIQPHWVAVSANDVYLRCGDGVVWYPVMKVSAGALLHVDGQGFKWLRVAYPKGAPAFVRAEEADPSPDGKFVTTNRPARLLAANLHSGLDGSWKALLGSPLPPGQRLALLGSVTDGADKVSAYRVEAPPQARAYISEEFVRPATDAEVMAAMNPPAPEQPEPAGARDDRPVAAATAPDASRAAPGAQSPAQPSADAQRPAEIIAPSPARPLSLHDVLERYGASGEEGAARADIPPAPAPSHSAPTSAQRDQPPAPASETTFRTLRPRAAEPQVAPWQPSTDDHRALPTIEQLDAGFTSVMAQPIAAAEIDPLVREHERLISALRGKPHTEGKIAYLERRARLLRIKADLQASMRRLEEAAERAAIAKASIDQRIDALDAKRVYPHTGRLVASALYDGKRLPLMYRLQTGSADAPTTLAYILPADDLDLRALLGAVVGVQGQESRDKSLGVPIIRPSRIEAISRSRAQATVPDDDR